MIAADLAVARQAKYRQEAKNGMAKPVPSGRLVNVPHEIAVKEGTLWAAIPRLIEKMASVQKVLLGSNAEQMFRQSAVPMLTVGPAAPSEPLYEAAFKHILSATDFGKGAEKEAGFALPLEHRSRLTVLHVATRTKQMAGLETESILRQRSEPVPDNHLEHCLVDFRVAFGKPVR